MSLYSMLRTSVSGMGAQSNLLGTVGDNIANAGTTGYKNAGAAFSSVMLATAGTGDYQSGSVDTTVTYGISKQGGLNYTDKTSTDLAVQGNGFFLVADSTGGTLLTRAGDFTLDASTGELKNSAGYTLLGYSLAPDAATGSTNSTVGLVPVNVGATSVTATASSSGTFTANLPSTAKPTDGKFTSTLTVFDALGAERSVEMTFEKGSTSSSGVSTWKLSVGEDAALQYSTSTTTTFDYAELSFDSSGILTGVVGYRTVSVGTPPVDTLTPTTLDPAALSVIVENSQASGGGAKTSVSLDISNMTQKATDFSVLTAVVNGNSASVIKDVAIESDGTVYGVNEQGEKFSIYKIPLGFVASTDNLTPVTGNAYTTNLQSGPLQIGTAEQNGLGAIRSGATENSTVDTATELTTMIIAQRDYTANSKVFQTGAELLDVLMNLKR
ncbi:flagellar hook protein FlgE [Xanthobacter sp. V4C-4]|uniref:flagellar hook protein FlgE n=1 Tax=Xanthobacter cornucopiae TaxID=3119924 RepID=UPI00372BCA5A